MKAITFLGALNAYPTEYVMPDGRCHVAPFFGAALARFVPELDMRVFVTRDARAKHLDTFLPLVEDHVRDVQAVDIPDGFTTDQLWTIFDTVVNNVDDGEEVVFDITHGFRSLPFLSFLAAAYLREVKEATLKAVYYGNFEARDQSVTPHRAPVIELSEFVQLLDWMIAADHFTKSGDSADLAELAERAKPDFRTASSDEQDAWRRSDISKTIGHLKRLSGALQLIRPDEAMKESAGLLTALRTTEESLVHYARPFSPLVSHVIDAYAPLAKPSSDPTRALETERELVQWYVERRQYVQATAIAREWVVSWVMLHAGANDILSKEDREEYTRALTARLPHPNKSEEAVIDLSHVEHVDAAAEIYSNLGSVRNDLLHAGKRRGAMTATTMESKIRKNCERLRELPIGVQAQRP